MKNMKVWIGFVVVLMAESVSFATVRTVPGQYASIQGAIDAAQDGDVVVVARGTYREAIDYKGRNITVRSTDPNDPATVAATTILFTSSVSVPRGTLPSGSTVTFDQGEGPGAVLAGFTITGGYGAALYHSDTAQYLYGGGILCYASSPTIIANVVTGNNGPLSVKVSDVTWYSYGGGIACIASDATIVRNVIQGNSAYYGAGVIVEQGHPRIADNLIYDNSGAIIGGGLALEYGGIVTNNTIVRNSASYGGGMYLYSDLNFGLYRITSNIISNARSGGDIYLGGAPNGDVFAFNNVGSYSGSGVAWPGGDAFAGNISVDPMFMNPAAYDFRLQADSRCINAGDPNYAAATGETDVYGNPRIDRGRVDIGAAEFSGDFRPVAVVGQDQSMTVVPAVITLDASGSYDPDPGTTLRYYWSQVSGMPVVLDANGPFARFAPGGYGAFVFRLVVSDGILDSVPVSTRVVIDNGRLPLAEAGLPAYTGGENVRLNGGDSRDPSGSAVLHYHWQQVSGPAVQISDANVAAPTISGFVRTDTLQACVFQLTVDDGSSCGLPDSVNVWIVPNTPSITVNLDSTTFDANKPTVIYFDGGDCTKSNGGGWNGSGWPQLANVFNINYGNESRSATGTYEKCGDAMVLYLYRQAPNYKMPIQTIGWSTGGQPAIDAGIRSNLTYKDARYAVNRVTFVDGCCRTYTASIAQYIASSVEGEQCWVDSYDSGQCSGMWAGALNAHVSNGNHSDPPSLYKASLTNAHMNDYNGGLVAGAYWSVVGPGKNLQLALTPDRVVYAFNGYNAVSSGYEYMKFYDEANYPARLPEPVTLLAPLDVGDPCGVVLTCKPSRNAVGYQLLFGRDPHRVMDFNVVSDTNVPPDTVIRELPFAETWWTVRVRDAYGSTIYADPVRIDAFKMSLPVQNTRTGVRYGAIQGAIDAAQPGDEIRLQPGTYHEQIILSPGVHVRSVNLDDPSAAAATIIDGGGSGVVVTCSGTGNSSFMLSGLTLANGTNGVSCSSGSLTITNCRVVGNLQGGIRQPWEQCRMTLVNCLIAGNKGAGVDLGSQTAGRITPFAVITNCTIVENGGSGVSGGKPRISNSILWSNGGGAATGASAAITYSDVQGGFSGQGNLNADPLFARAGSGSGGAWVPGDYHLQSQGGRWEAETGVWVRDAATSPCIDAGDPVSPLGREPATIPGATRANTRVDMGLYGGTIQASLAP